MYKYTFLLACAIACFSCQETSTTSTAAAYEKPASNNTAADIDSIKALYRNIVEACNTVNAERLVSYHSRSEEFTFTNNETIHPGHDSLYTLVKQMYSGLKSQSLHYKDIDIQMLSDDYAVGTTNGDFTTLTKDGKTLSGEGSWTFLFSREPSGWKVLKVHQSIKMKS